MEENYDEQEFDNTQKKKKKKLRTTLQISDTVSINFLFSKKKKKIQNTNFILFHLR